MKALKYILPILFVGFSACELTEVNTDPNELNDVPMETILPRAQFQVANATYNDCAGIVSIFMQYLQGNPSTNFTRVNSYDIDNSFYIQDVWTSFYADPMEYFKIIIAKAEQQNAPHYAAIAKILQAYSLGTLSSLWGDVPYSEAFQGSENLNPKYDSQKLVYETIQNLLNSAIADLNLPAGEVSPAAVDLYYGGDAGKWKKAAHALKARYFIHLSKRSAELGFNPVDSALVNIALAFSNNDTDLEYPYGYSASEENSYFRGKNETDLVVTTNFGGKIISTDPRYRKMVIPKFGKWDIGPFYSKADSKMPLITYFELKFIEAEARLRINASDPQIEVALKEAIRANMQKMDTAATLATINTFIDSHVALTGDFNNDLNVIMTQKYLAMFLQPEAWTDYRRTGIPALVPNPAGDNATNVGGGIPRRLPYVWTERELNANCPAGGVQMQDRFWWDIE